MGSIIGAFMAAFIIGFSDSFGASFIGRYHHLISFGTVMVILLFRPLGPARHRRRSRRQGAMSPHGRVGRLAAVAIVLFLVAFSHARFFPSRWQQIAILWAIWSTVGMSWLVILRVGEFSAGQAVFLCLGGYGGRGADAQVRSSGWCCQPPSAASWRSSWGPSS